MNTVILPAGWEQHAAPVATLLDPLGPSLVWWGAAVLILIAAIALCESRPTVSLVLALLSTPILAIATNGLVDDAYIQFRYAANAAAGRGPVFNPGERIEGASGGAWIGLIALASAVTGRDAARCGRVLSLAAACLASVAAAAFGHAIAGRRGAARVAIVWAAVPTAALYAATGLESPAFACALWGLGAAVAGDRRGPAAVAGAVAAVLRPEGIVLLAGSSPFWRRLDRSGRAALIGAALGTAVIVGARLAYYGWPVPRPALVKGVTAAAGFDSGLRYLGRVGFEWWPLFPVILWIGPRWKRLLPVLLPAAVWTCLVAARGGDWMPGGRYLLPVLVVLAGGVAVLPARRAARLLMIGSVAWSLLLLMPRLEPFGRESRLPVGWAWRAMAEHRAQSRWWEALGAWVRGFAPPGTYLAVGPAGALPYAARLSTFDMYGLCTTVTHRNGHEAGHRLWGLSEAVAAGADLIYPGRDLLLVESPDAILPASNQHSSALLEEYQSVTISHVPEYRLDFLRDAIWIRRELLPASPGPGPPPTGR